MSANASTRIYVVHEDPVVQAGLVILLCEQADFTVTAAQDAITAADMLALVPSAT